MRLFLTTFLPARTWNKFGIPCLEVILIATIKIHDEWEGLARMLADLITKYADVLEDQDKPNLSNEEEQDAA